MMLCKIVEAHGGTLPDDVIVTFANTGKEREETLVFVSRFFSDLGINVRWIEYRPNGEEWKFGATAMQRWKEVSFITASRNGEPFAEMIRRNNRPPTVVDRVCTAYLKTKPMEGFMLSTLGTRDYARAVGMRADEPRRVARMRANNTGDFVLPLADAGVTQADVRAFWDAMPFDLELPTIGGETVHGNCDLCYLKGAKKIASLIREDPSRADWWIKQEEGGTLFRVDRPNYAAMKVIALQPKFDFEPQEEALPCECTD